MHARDGESYDQIAGVEAVQFEMIGVELADCTIFSVTGAVPPVVQPSWVV